MKATCCGQERDGKFCSECGKPFSGSLRDLLLHIERNASAMRKRLNTFAEKRPEILTSNKGLNKRVQKWESWRDGLAKLISDSETKQTP